MIISLLTFHILIQLKLIKVSGVINILERGVSPLEKYSVAIQFFVDVENEDTWSACEIYIRIKKCCYTDSDKEDCGTMYAYGKNSDILKPKDRKTLLYIYPTLYPHDQVGYCKFIMNSLCADSRTKTHEVLIPFDTRLSSKEKGSSEGLSTYIEGSNQMGTACETLDEDPLHDCAPVNCEMKYSDERSYYDTYLNRCVRVPECTGNSDSEMPGIVYVPSNNECRDLDHPLTFEDIYAINTGLGTVTILPEKVHKHRQVELWSNCTSISENFNFITKIMFGKLYPVLDGDAPDYKRHLQMAFISIFVSILGLTLVLLFFVYCVHASVWIFNRWSTGTLGGVCENVISILRIPKGCKAKEISVVSSEDKDTLLREVITKEIPLELRDSIEYLCDMLEENIQYKKRCKRNLGNQARLHRKLKYRTNHVTTATSSVSENDELETLLK